MAILATMVIGGAALGACATAVWTYRQRLRRENHVRTYMFPRGVFEKFAQARPGIPVKDQQLVARALRQFFLAFLKSGGRRVAMPSQVADDLWHEFILYTRDYKLFCDLAFGRFLHHTPAVKLGAVQSDNEGLRRVWWHCCIEENINPRNATRLPLLFALDRKLGIAGGFVYELRCRRPPNEVLEGSGAGSQCAESFSDSSIDGGTDGFGCSSGHGVGDSGGGDGGCSGGCGGGD